MTYFLGRGRLCGRSAASRTSPSIDPNRETPASHMLRGLVLRNPPLMQTLMRSETDRVIAGVAGGIAQRLGVNSTLVRLAWVLSVFFGGLGVVVYLILWVVLPKGSAHTPTSRIAEERFARGEITAGELERIRGDLRAAP
jgi:phage shock protein C